jgi:hypothetical protein
MRRFLLAVEVSESGGVRAVSSRARRRIRDTAAPWIDPAAFFGLRSLGTAAPRIDPAPFLIPERGEEAFHLAQEGYDSLGIRGGGRGCEGDEKADNETDAKSMHGALLSGRRYLGGPHGREDGPRTLWCLERWKTGGFERRGSARQEGL